MSTIAFATNEQLVLWESEISGQISDGNWENARPFGHHRPWCEATAVVDPQNPGRDFYAPKDNYNLTSPELLEAVGQRMQYRLALARQQPEAVARCKNHRLPESDADWEENLGESWKQEYVREWKAAGLTKLTQAAPTMKELRKVLTEMKTIVKMRRN